MFVIFRKTIVFISTLFAVWLEFDGCLLHNSGVYARAYADKRELLAATKAIELNSCVTFYYAFMWDNHIMVHGIGVATAFMQITKNLIRLN